MAEIYACLLYFETHRTKSLQALAEHLDWSRQNFDAAEADNKQRLQEIHRRKLGKLLVSRA